jgi:ABC-type transporter Mla MlaB component
MATSPPNTITFAIWGPIARADVSGLCDRVCALIATSGAATAVCDIAGVPADAVTVDALARLQLAAGRQNCRIQLRNPSDQLHELAQFMGLEDVLAL